MSNDEADQISTSLERKWDDKHKKDFIGRMERKMYRKEIRTERH